MMIILFGGGGGGGGREHTFVGDQLIAESRGVEQTLRGSEGEPDVRLKVGWKHSL